MPEPLKARRARNVRPAGAGAIIFWIMASLIVAVVSAQESADRRPPEVLGESGSWGQTWTSASSVFDEHGSVSASTAAPLREQLLAQSADFRLRLGSAAAQGLTDGEIDLGPARGA